MERIFIQIASYRDTELLPTVRHALLTAAHPERLTFGICYQDDDMTAYEELKTIPNVRCIVLTIRECRGACYARHLTGTLYEGEEYTLQIDSHMRFVSGWDERVIEQFSQCIEPAVLTAYCDGYDPEVEKKELSAAAPAERAGHLRHMYDDADAAVLCADNYTRDSMLMFIAGETVPAGYGPVHGAFWSGHFSFARGSIIRDVPYDPELYFHGEEISFAVRAFTKGYNIYYPSRGVCLHFYERTGRPLHWDDADFDVFDENSKRKVRRLLGIEPAEDEDFGPYGLGTVRTLEEYETYSGVDFKNRHYNLHAKCGWYETGELYRFRKMPREAADLCLCTAFYDIGRSDWNDEFRRSTAFYIECFEQLTRIENLPLVLYCEEQTAAALPEGVPERLQELHPLELWDTFFSLYYREEREISRRRAFWNLMGVRMLSPEHRHARYSMMTHSKANFVRRTKELYPGHSHYGWIDFGIARFPIPRGVYADFTPQLTGKIRMQFLGEPPSAYPSDPVELCKESPEAMSASCFIIPSELVEWYEDAYERELIINHAAGICDDEQNIMLRLAQKYPQYIDADTGAGWYSFFLNSVTEQG